GGRAPPAGDGLAVEAEAHTAGASIAVDLCRVPAGGDVPMSLVERAVRSRETVIVDDPPPRPRSRMVLPLLNGAHLAGALYLENDLTPGAFTKNRVELLVFLGAHAAIALD